MNSFQKKILFAAVFVFATGFASTAVAIGDCTVCKNIYTSCMARPNANEEQCVIAHNRCAGPRGCPVMPL